MLLVSEHEHKSKTRWGRSFSVVVLVVERGAHRYVASKSVAMMHEHLWDPTNVVDALRGAVTLRQPRGQLLVGVDAQFALPLARHFPSWVLEALTRLKAFPKMPTIAALANKT
jgi:hypothetical protein